MGDVTLNLQWCDHSNDTGCLACRTYTYLSLANFGGSLMTCSSDLSGVAIPKVTAGYGPFVSLFVMHDHVFPVGSLLH